MKYFTLLKSVITATIDAVNESEVDFYGLERDCFAASLKYQVRKWHRMGELTDRQKEELIILIDTIYV